MSSNNEETQTPHTSPFETIRKTSEEGIEYWSARDLASILDYAKWEKFRNVIKKAEEACKNSFQAVSDHFLHVGKMVTLGSGSQRKIEDVHLSRYAAYLVVQNADPSKEIVALGQTYFAVQTHRQEQADILESKAENEKRLFLREQLTDNNRLLAATATQAGVVRAVDFAVFQDHGYMGLYGGLRAKDIHARKNLKRSQHILDHMGSTELAANIFRATQTEDKIRREGIKDKGEANRTHHEMGRKVREFIKEVGGTPPEDLPTPKESIKQLRQQERKQIEREANASLLDEPLE
jgi:DNA-damage-inducible protein D